LPSGTLVLLLTIIGVWEAALHPWNVADSPSGCICEWPAVGAIIIGNAIGVPSIDVAVEVSTESPRLRGTIRTQSKASRFRRSVNSLSCPIAV
jgi:hypothetical protein